jgi:hypothetical protein
MNNENFRVPLVIYCRRTGFCLISSVSQAADFLSAYEGEQHRPAWAEALDCCSGVKRGATTPEQVSQAFINAVTGIGIRIDTTLRLY